VVNDALFAEDPESAAEGAEASARVRVDQFLDRLGWRVPDAPGRGTLAQVLTALRRLGEDVASGSACAARSGCWRCPRRSRRPPPRKP
jgi:hypothetical protein